MFDFFHRNLRLVVLVPAIALAFVAAAHGMSAHHFVALACNEGTVCPP